MDAVARLTSKGQITIPKHVREALGLQEGDAVHFRVEGGRAALARTPDLLELAGAVEVPAAVRGRLWAEVAAEARAAMAQRHAGTDAPPAPQA